MALKVLICVLLGYCVGSVNPSFIIAKLKGFDIRQSGSGNAGGSNAIITMGKRVGAFCCIFDILKAAAVVRLVIYLFPEVKIAFAVSSVSCILGHMFPWYMHFRGGKGLACLGGSILGYSPEVFAIMLLIELALALIVDYICIVPITASIAFPIVYGMLEDNIYGALILLIATVAMVYKHIENLRRINQGTELHFSYLWHKKKEVDRLSANINKIDPSALKKVFREKDKE